MSVEQSLRRSLLESNAAGGVKPCAVDKVQPQASRSCLIVLFCSRADVRDVRDLISDNRVCDKIELRKHQ